MQKAKSRIILFYTFVYGLLTPAFGQVPNTNARVTISSPNAASLGKFGDVPVSYHTGIPEINIPIYTIKAGTLTLPISLEYHASGLKVQEQASWVGAGWALNAGGVITRTVIGAPDDKGLRPSNTQKGHFSDFGYNSYLFGLGPAFCDQDQNGNGPFYCPTGRDGMPASFYPPQDQNIQTGVFDGEPDLFFFNFNGHAGKFYFNDYRTPVLVPEQDLQITPVYPDNDWRGITGFIITTPDGTKYYFGQNQSNDNNIDALEITYNVTTQVPETGHGATSAWYLNKIVSADGVFTITLTYQAESFSYYALSMYPIPAVRNPNFFAYNLEYDLDKNFIDGVRLAKISFPNGEVDFNAGSLRQDLSLGMGRFPHYNYSGIADNPNTDVALGGRALDNINIRTANYCKKYSFSTSYFFDNTPLTGNLFATFGSAFHLQSDQYRLRLDSVTESSCDGSLTIPPYKFSYAGGIVPRKLSFGIDHWGFSNGVTTNTGLIPTYTIIPQAGQVGSSGSSVTTVDGANRDAAWPAMYSGALNMISYPTGGTTSFEFEPNNIYGILNTSGTVNIANMAVAVYGQGAGSSTSTFNVDGSSNSVNLFLTSTCNWSCSVVITNSSNVVVYNGGLSNWDGFTGNDVHSLNTINLPPGEYQATLSLPSYASNITGGVQATISQWRNTTVNTPLMVGGLRIKTITNKDGITSQNVVTSYGYNYNNITGGQSSGTLYSVPVYVQGLRNDAWGIVNGESCSASGCFYCFGSKVAYYQSPSSIRPMSTSQGNHIGYGEVYVSQGNNGYTRYKYYGSNGDITGPWTPLQTDVCKRVLTTFCDPNLPNSPATPLPFDPMRGELASVSIFNQGGQLVKNMSYFPYYQLDPSTTPGIISKFYITGYQMAATPPSLNEGFDPELTSANLSNIMVPVGIQTFSEYYLQSAKKVKDSVVTQTYDPVSGNYLTDINATYYGSDFHHQPTRVVTKSSSGEVLQTNFTNAMDYRITGINMADPWPTYYDNVNRDKAYLYNALANFTLPPSDPLYYWDRLNTYTNYRYMKAVDRMSYLSARQNYSNAYLQAFNSSWSNADGEQKPILELQNHYQNPVIEQSHWLNGILTRADFNKFDYGLNPYGAVYPGRSQQISLAYPSTSFVGSYLSGKTLIKDNRYRDETIYQFSNGNLQYASPKNGLTASYIWDYGNTQPIAVATGAASNQIAYTSFEGDGTGGWTLNPGYTIIDNSDGSPTGTKSFSGTIFKTVPPDNYTLTLWSKFDANSTVNGAQGAVLITKGNWQLRSWTLRNTSSIQIVAQNIDELRLYPQGAQMVTYTYQPLLGITSECDIANRITYYEYDALGRLSIVRDQDKNIMKKYCYNYQGLPASCGFKCDASQCSGPDKKCMNGICEVGQRKYRGSAQQGDHWVCTYYFQWSDGSISPDFTEVSSISCLPLHS